MVSKEETKDAVTRTPGEGRLYRRAKPQPLQFRLIASAPWSSQSTVSEILGDVSMIVTFCRYRKCYPLSIDRNLPYLTLPLRIIDLIYEHVLGNRFLRCPTQNGLRVLLSERVHRLRSPNHTAPDLRSIANLRTGSASCVVHAQRQRVRRC